MTTAASGRPPHADIRSLLSPGNKVRVNRKASKLVEHAVAQQQEAQQHY